MTDKPRDPNAQPEDDTIPTRDWIPYPVVDSSDYLDKPAPRYAPLDPNDTTRIPEAGGETIHLRPVAERDAMMQELVETVHYVNRDGSPYQPDELPVVQALEDEERED